MAAATEYIWFMSIYISTRTAASTPGVTGSVFMPRFILCFGQCNRNITLKMCKVLMITKLMKVNGIFIPYN